MQQPTDEDRNEPRTPPRQITARRPDRPPPVQRQHTTMERPERPPRVHHFRVLFEDGTTLQEEPSDNNNAEKPTT